MDNPIESMKPWSAYLRHALKSDSFLFSLGDTLPFWQNSLAGTGRSCYLYGIQERMHALNVTEQLWQDVASRTAQQSDMLQCTRCMVEPLQGGRL